MTYIIKYFARLAEEAGRTEEQVNNAFPDLRTLYAHLQAQHGLSLNAEQLRPAKNLQFCSWDEAPQDGDEIAFIPPVAGG